MLAVEEGSENSVPVLALLRFWRGDRVSLSGEFTGDSSACNRVVPGVTPLLE